MDDEIREMILLEQVRHLWPRSALRAMLSGQMQAEIRIRKEEKQMTSEPDHIVALLLQCIERLADWQKRSPSAMAARLGGHGHTYATMKEGGAIQTNVAARMFRAIPGEWPDEIPLPYADPFRTASAILSDLNSVKRDVQEDDDGEDN